MFQSIKSIINTALLCSGSYYFKDRFSKVIYYHDIHGSEEDKYSDMSTSIALFIEHLNIIKSMGFEVVREITAPVNQIQINFDDGFRGLYEYNELLISHNVFPTVFIITSLVGEPNYLTWAELRILDEKGFIVQSHTHLHKDLNTLNEEQLFRELSVSKLLLESNLQKEITEICFPKGLFNDLVLNVCAKVGYKKWYCSIPGNYQDYFKFKKLKYRNLVQFATPLDFRNIILGGLQVFKNRYSKQHYGIKI